MQEATTVPPQPPRGDDDRQGGTPHEVDPRDETIRLLNEALGEALAELERLNDDRAA